MAGRLHQPFDHRPGRGRIVDDQDPTPGRRLGPRRGRRRAGVAAQGRADHAGGVEDQGDPPRRLDRGAGEEPGVADPRPEALDHHLLLGQQLVDQEGHPALARGDDHGGDLAIARGLAAGQAQGLGERGQREERAPARGQDPAAFDRAEVGLADPHQLLDVGRGQGEDLAAGREHECPEGRQREWDGQDEPEPPARPGVKVDRPVELLQPVLDHVQPDPPARDGGDPPGRGEPGQEDHPLQVARVRRLVDPPPPGLVAEPVEVEAEAVVGDDHLDLRPPERGRDRDPPPGRLARLDSPGGGLDPVVDRVVDQVAERVLERLQDRAVDLDLAPLDRQLDLLAEVAGDVAGGSLQALAGLGEGEHPGVADLVLQAGRGAVELGPVAPHRLRQPLEVAVEPAEALAGPADRGRGPARERRSATVARPAQEVRQRLLDGPPLRPPPCHELADRLQVLAPRADPAAGDHHLAAVRQEGVELLGRDPDERRWRRRLGREVRSRRGRGRGRGRGGADRPEPGGGGFEAGDQGGQRRAIQAGLLAEPGAGLLDGVDRPEEESGRLRGEGQAAVPPGGEEVFEEVAGRLDRPGVDRPRRPLHAVRGPEHRAERLGPVLPLLHRQEVAVEPPDVLVELAEERGHQPLDEGVPVHRRRRPARARRSRPRDDLAGDPSIADPPGKGEGRQGGFAGRARSPRRPRSPRHHPSDTANAYTYANGR